MIRLFRLFCFCVLTLSAIITMKAQELYICGKKVTAENCKNLTVIDGVTLTKRNGVAMFDPKSKTLALKNVELVDKSGKAIQHDIEGLNVKVSETVQVQSNATDGVGIVLDNVTIFEGVGTATLNVSGKACGLLLNAGMGVSSLTLNVRSGNFAISGGSTTSGKELVKLYKGILAATGKETVIKALGNTGSIVNLQSLRLNDGLAITDPAGAEFTNHAVCLGKQPVKNQIVVIQYQEQQHYPKGDVNHDGKVDISDVVAVINTMAGDTTFKATSDVNADGDTNISDVVAIINIMANGGEENPEPEQPDAAVVAGICPDNHHPHAIDMGYGGRWACCNVGASAPWETGGQYAWGETEPKEKYDWSTYIHCDGVYYKCHDLGSDISYTDYDPAHVNWGSLWRMPSDEQFMQLFQSGCQKDSTVLNGVPGMKYTATNGNCVFIPFATVRSDLEEIEVKTAYWTSMRHSYIPNVARGFYVDSSMGTPIQGFHRCVGCMVRPILDENIEDENIDPAVFFNICPDKNHPHIIDLGKAGKWLCCNLGASTPWEYGDYYAWGETEPKDPKLYDWENYKLCDGTKDGCEYVGNDIAGTAYDAAQAALGAEWRLPGYEQFTLLGELTEREWFTLKGMNGTLLKAENGNCIFLPGAGYRQENGGIHDRDINCYYWSSQMHPAYPYVAYCLDTKGYYYGLGSEDRICGMPIRPVVKATMADPAVTAGLCPDGNHPHEIDLGTGKKWACCNVGARSPWEYGGFYAWGETEVKPYWTYNWDTYSLCDGTQETCRALGENIATTGYDVARKEWGGSWSMPSTVDCLAIIDDCTFEWLIFNGVEGAKVTGKNGNSIFIPGAGYRWADMPRYRQCVYWTSEQSADYAHRAYQMLLDDTQHKVNEAARCIGLLIRPVK